MSKKKPDLQVVDPTDTPEPESAPEPAPEPATAPVTIGQQITNYAALVAQIRKDFRLSEGGVIRLVELSLNERFTLIQMGLTRPRTSETPTEDTDGNSNEG